MRCRLFLFCIFMPFFCNAQVGITWTHVDKLLKHPSPLAYQKKEIAVSKQMYPPMSMEVSIPCLQQGFFCIWEDKLKAKRIPLDFGLK